MKKLDFLKNVNPQVLQLFLIVIFLGSVLFYCQFCIKKQKTEDGKPKHIIGQMQTQTEPQTQLETEPNWYNPRNRIVTLSHLDSMLIADVENWKENPCDSTRAVAESTFKTYTELGSKLIIPLPEEPIEMEIQILSYENQERIKDLQSLRSMIFQRIKFAEKNRLVSSQEAKSAYDDLGFYCPAIILGALLTNSDSNEELLKDACQVSVWGRYIYECSIILENHEKLKDFDWYPKIAESAVQTLYEKNPQRLLLLKQQVQEIKGGKEAILLTEKLLASK